jgi:hypothetical protein
VEARPAKEEALGNGAVASAGPVSQFQSGTGNLSPATQVKASDPGSSPKTVNHPNKDRMQDGVSSAPVSPSAVPAAKPSQSQDRTGSPSQPKEAATVFKSQPEDRKSGKTIYSDEPRRSVYAQDFVFRVP